LQQEQIDVFVSSPYERAIQTIKAAAGNSEMIQYEDLRERSIGNSREHSFRESKRMAYEDFDHSFPEGESSRSAQQRAVATFLQLLVRHEGQKIAIGTHGDIMTLMMNHFDPAYHFEFWESTSMPDIYKLEFEGTRLIEVTRVWK
jgi:2,3-bisphosphoglycerate-dependent phosphoglycerate mutase